MLLDGDQAATVFLSYSRGDQKRALPVIKALEAAGIKVWWDGLLEGGDTFLPTTEAALEGADAVVVLWSKTSVDSHWVRDEATRGRERGCLVPLTIDGTHAPLGFRQFQTINISKWRGKAGAPEIERMVRAVHGFAGLSHTQPMPLPRQSVLSRRALIGSGGAMLVGGAALAGWQFFKPSPAMAAAGSVAVLPFRNLSGDRDKDYFAEGISEQIRSTLARNAKLLVLAPTTISTVTKDGIADLKDVAAKLGVAFVLSGSVRQSGEMLRISSILTDAKTGKNPWDAEFDKLIGDVFAVQDEIADAVAGALAAQTVTGGKHVGKTPGGTSNLKAYDAFLRGNSYYALRTGEAAYRAALAQYDAALAEDSKFAAAHAARARTIVIITNSYGQASEFKSNYDDALEAASAAVALAPDLAITQSTLGYVLVQGKLDLRAAVKPFEKARQLGQGDATVMTLCGIFAAQSARFEEAEQAVARAIKLDPLNPGAHRIAAYAANCAGNWTSAIERARKALALNPKIDSVHGIIGDALVQQGKFTEARSEYALEPDMMVRLTGLAITATRMNDIGAAKAATDKVIAEFGDAGSYQQAQILAQSNQPDLAMAKLLHAREIGDVGLALAYTDPMLAPLRPRPDFKQLLTELGFG